MTTLSVIFVWHMHQPYYQDMAGGGCMMPWVRLHACRGYLDMARALDKQPGAKAVINLSPGLVRQLEDQAAGRVKDDFLLISEKQAEILSPMERAYVLRYFFMSDLDAMIRPHGEFLRLYSKRGAKTDQDFEQTQKRFSDQELRDLVVWFNLSWFGWSALEDCPELVELKRKNSDFTEKEKHFVLERQRHCLTQVLPAYQRLWREGAAEISASPLFHPILPLLWDSVLGDRAHHGISLPPRFRRPEDARDQIQLGLDCIESVLGRRPVGMWPPEGGVAPELAEPLISAGLRWIATDEELLFKRIRGHRRDENLCHPWKVRDQDRELIVLFRDKILSNLIGFEFAKIRPSDAIEDFIRRLREIRSSISRLGQDHALAVIALDGENPWQSYPDAGARLVSGLYQRIQETEGLELETASGYLEKHPPSRTLDQLPTGSWIKQNFDIWIGGAEENKAWEYLGKVRDDFERIAPEAEPEQRAPARDSIFAAEGSDWFWWFGDDFQSELKCEFDFLFRMHLKNSYLLLGQDSPQFLNDPVLFHHPVRVAEEPMDFINPTIDGKISDYYEWRAAGHLDIRQSLGAIYRAGFRLQHIYYGFDLDNFYLRIDPDLDDQEMGFIDAAINILSPRKLTIMFPLKGTSLARIYEEREDGTRVPIGEVHDIASYKILELRVPFSALGLKTGDEVRFVVQLFDGQTELETHPRDGFIRFTVPDENFEARYWSA